MKAIKTNEFSNKCDCGEIVKMKQWIEVNDAQSTYDAAKQAADDETRWLDLAQCKCGNLFIKDK